jgi:hypothetical protein
MYEGRLDIDTAANFAGLGSKRLQLEWGGGATPFPFLDLKTRDAISIPTAPTKILDDSVAFMPLRLT